MSRVEYNASDNWGKPSSPAVSIGIHLGTTQYDYYRDKHVPHDVLVRYFVDVASANRIFG